MLEICAQLKDAKAYVRTPLMTRFPEPENVENVEETETSAQVPTGTRYYHLKTFRTFVGDIGGLVQAFPCKTHSSRVYWIADNHTAERRIFLLRNADGRGLAFVGQAEPIPKINDKYPEGDTLDDYFRKTYLSKNTNSYIWN